MGCHTETAKRKEHAQIHVGRIVIDTNGVEKRVKRERKTPCVSCGDPVLRLGKRATGAAVCDKCRKIRTQFSRHGLNSGRGRLSTIREFVETGDRFQE